MGYRKITAIIDVERLEAVEAELKQLNIPGLSVSFVKGYGEYKNFFDKDWLKSNAKIDVFVHKRAVGKVIDAVKRGARSGVANAGIVAVLPVEEFHEISNGAPRPSTEGRA